MTIKDIARLCGVSVSTVSRVLNDRPDVSEENRRRVPEDCSVIAIDGLTMSEYFHPMLTTLCQPMEEMGRRSVEILMDMIHGRGRPRCETVRTVLRRGASVRRIN